MFVRQLNEEDWEEYRRLRLEAVRLHAANYGASYTQEVARTDEYWKKAMCCDERQSFGMFDNNRMVGIGAVMVSREDEKDAVLIAGYIQRTYRGKGYSRLLYEQRIQWAIDSGRFNRILVGHVEGNEASRRANQAFGFEYTGKKEMTFGNGKTAIEYQYEVRLR